VATDNPVVVYGTTSFAEAEITKSMLENEGIQCELEGEHQASLTGILNIRLLVRQEDQTRAEELLAAPQHRHK
jgi:hypothetical protein